MLYNKMVKFTKKSNRKNVKNAKQTLNHKGGKYGDKGYGLWNQLKYNPEQYKQKLKQDKIKNQHEVYKENANKSIKTSIENLHDFIDKQYSYCKNGFNTYDKMDNDTNKHNIKYECLDRDIIDTNGGVTKGDSIEEKINQSITDISNVIRELKIDIGEKIDMKKINLEATRIVTNKLITKKPYLMHLSYLKNNFNKKHGMDNSSEPELEVVPEQHDTNTDNIVEPEQYNTNNGMNTYGGKNKRKQLNKNKSNKRNKHKRNIKTKSKKNKK